MLSEVAENLWEATQPLRVAGFDLGHRMVVIRLGSGEVLVYSPIGLSSAVVEDLKRLGPVKFLIAPSSMHDLYLKDWMQALPQATLLHSPALKLRGLDERRTKPISPGMFSELEDIPVGGMPKIQESAFLHHPSRTLILCDLVFNLPPGSGFQKLLQKMNGIYERLGPSKFFRAYIKNQGEFQQSLGNILGKDFDRLIVSHGNNVETNGQEALRGAFTRSGSIT